MESLSGEEEAGPSKESTIAESNSSKEDSSSQNDGVEESPWANIKPAETKSRDEEMEDYLQELLL